MAIKQIVPIYITLLGDAAATTFVFPVQNLFQQGFGGSVPFGVTGSIPSSASANNPPYPVTSVAVDANGNITITFTSAPPAVEFQLELDITFNSGSATSSTPTVSQNVTLTGTSTVTISGTSAVNLAQLNGVALGSPSNYGTSPGAVAVQGVNAFITNTPAVTVSVTVGVTQSTSPWVVSLTSTTITGTVAVTQNTSPWVVAGGLTHNNAAPAANNVGVLPAVASTAAPTYTTGDQVLLSTDLSGNLRVSGTFASGALVDLVGTLVALNALNTAATINAFGYLAVGGFLAAGTLVGTIVAETSFDGGTTWTGTYFDIGNKVSSIVFGSANTATSFSIIGSAGASNMRVRVSAFTSGTATCTLRANEVHDPTVLFTGLVAATVQPPLLAQTGGWVTTAAPTYSNTTANAVSLTTAGGIRCDNSSVNGTALGTPTAFGTTPGAVTALQVNASLFQGTTA